ncbi:MAG TPA: glycosyltransferase family 2 protein [Solirubrobacteraceae bacterium]|nr:glycosyltransferase family 2 protein [Solirubrobacteraceae bacterium]
MPRVSVIIPAHNAAAFLREALQSVRDQTFSDWEVIAVDDGSADATWSILEAGGSRVRAFRNASATGPAAARNRALEHATGELVAFLDADDLLLPQFLERQIACLRRAASENRNVGIVACDALLLDEDTYAGYTYLDQIPSRDRPKPLTLDRILERNPIYISSLVPTAVGEAVGWFDVELFGTEDFGLWVKILERGYEAILNPEPLAVYRRHTGTVSSNIARQGANNRRTYELALARGALSPRQRAIARRGVRYNRAMEVVATLRFRPPGHASARQVVRALPLLAWVALTNPRWWKQWVAVLRTGRQPVAGRPRGKRAQDERA